MDSTAQLKGQTYTLARDCSATVIPAGSHQKLARGSKVIITQALGSSVTVSQGGQLFRIEAGEADALGPEVVSLLSRAAEQEPSPANGEFGESQVWSALRACYDPEIPVNIVDLGLIYDLRLEPANEGRYRVGVRMTLTAQGCGMGPVIADDARKKIEALPEVEEAVVEIVWDPPWNPHMISPAGRKMLGLE